MIPWARELTIVAVIGAAAFPVTGATMPTAADLVNKYTQALDSLNSTILKVDVRSDYEYAFDRNWVDPFVRGSQDKGTKFGREEYITDGTCFHSRVYEWGHITPQKPVVPEEHAHYQCRNWDNTEFYQHTRAIDVPTLPGSVNLVQSAQKYKLWPRIPPTSYIMGYNLAGDERMDAILTRATRIRVRPRTEVIGGSACYVLDADTSNGKMSLWLDPAHGFHPAKVETALAEGDKDYERVLPPGERRVSRLENVSFKQVDGVWVPVEADVHLGKNFSGGNNFVRTDYHFQATEVVLNPNHEALGSFDSPITHPQRDPELKNGTFIYKAGTPIKYLWLDGQMIPETDTIAVRELEQIADQIIAEDTVPPALAPDRRSEPTTLSARDLLEAYAETQKKLEIFMAEAESVVDYPEESRQETQRGDFRTDGERIVHRVSFQDGLLATKENPGYRSFLWDGTRLIQYWKGMNPRNDRVFVTKDPGSKARLLATEYKGAPLLGFCPGDSERFDRILRQAKEVSILVDHEVVGGMKCHVLEGRTEHGRYKVWIDPEHSYHFARLQVERPTGDAMAGTQNPPKGTSCLIEIVRFAKVDGIWVPMEANVQTTGDGRTPSMKWTHRRIKVALNPDEDALQSFVPDDIPEGTTVRVAEDLGTAYVWRNGEPAKEVKNDETRQ